MAAYCLRKTEERLTRYTSARVQDLVEVECEAEEDTPLEEHDEEHIDLDKLNNVPDLKSEVKKLRRKLSERKKLSRKNSVVEDVGTGLVQVVGGVGTVTATVANEVVLKPLAFALNPLASLFAPPTSQDDMKKAYETDDESLFDEDEEIDDLVLN